MNERSKPKVGRRLDISKPASKPSWGSNVSWIFFILLVAVCFLVLDRSETLDYLKVAGLGILAGLVGVFLFFGCLLFLVLVVQRGIWTWGRLATLPARLYAQKDEEGAWRAFDRALARARRFRENDPRRAQMYCDLAMFLSNQTHYARADALNAEAVVILEALGDARIADLATVRNNWAVSRIDRLQYAAAQKELEKNLDALVAYRKHAPSRIINFNANLGTVEYILGHNLTVCFLRTGATEEAEKQLAEVKQVLDAIPKGNRKALIAHLHLLQAEVFYQRGQANEAFEALDRIDQSNAKLSYPIRVKILVGSRDYQAAAELEERAVEMLKENGPLPRPPWWEFELIRAEIAFQNNEFDRAVQHLEASLDLRVQFDLPTFYNHAGWLKAWLTRLRNKKLDTLADRVDAELAWAQIPNEAGITVLERYQLQPARSLQGE